MTMKSTNLTVFTYSELIKGDIMSGKGVNYQSNEYIKNFLGSEDKPIDYQKLNKGSLMNERPPLNLTDRVIKKPCGELLYPDTWSLL